MTIENHHLSRRTQSRRWKIIHGTHFMLGGLCLIAGSSMYFTRVIELFKMAFTAGGWLLSIGSTFLLLADLQEWWYNRIGCCFDQNYRDEYELVNKAHFQNSDRLERISPGMNRFVAACGSANYVLGSILLIPIFKKYVILGNWLIIIGSILIFFSSIWKIYRTNILSPTAALFVDLFSAFGGIFYFLGVMLLLPYFITNDFRLNLSASLCVTGGFCFFIASLFLQYVYYFMK